MGHFIGSVWNFLVGIAPTVLHTVCQLVEGAAKVVTLGTGAPPA